MMLLEGYTAGSGERTISASVSIVTGSETDPFLTCFHEEHLFTSSAHTSSHEEILLRGPCLYPAPCWGPPPKSLNPGYIV